MSTSENLPAVVEEQEHAIEVARAKPARTMGVLPTPEEWAGITTMARTICTTELVPSSYRNRPEAVIAAILVGREIGIGPMQSMRDITMIDGRPTLAASLMLSKMRENGVVVLESVVDDDRAWIRARRSDTGEVAEVEWTYAEAEKIQRGSKKLVDGDGWKNYRQDMLWARCVGRLARRLAPDYLSGNLYSTEEVKDFEPATATTTYDSVNDGSSPYFDRGAELLPGAIGRQDETHDGTSSAPQRIMERLNFIDPTVDWPATIKAVVQRAYGVDGWKEIEESRIKEFWIRLANATQRAGADMAGDFPPVETGVIIEAFTWAFEIDSVELVISGEVEPDEKNYCVECGNVLPDDAHSDDCPNCLAPEEADAVTAEIADPATASVVEAPDPATLAEEAAATEFGEADK